MQPEAPTTPHVWILLSNVITAILAVITTLKTLQFKQKREPAEVRKIDAEAHGLKVAADISPVGITLETLREIQTVIQKAEQRREDWLLKEDQLRTQILFWRNKAEELDGALIDARYENAQLGTRLKMKTDDLEKAIGLLKAKHISFSEADQPRTE